MAAHHISQSKTSVRHALRQELMTCKRIDRPVIDADRIERHIGAIVMWESMDDVLESVVPVLSRDFDVVVIGRRDCENIKEVDYEVHVKPWMINHGAIAIALRLAEYFEVGRKRWQFDRKFFERFRTLGIIHEQPEWDFQILQGGRATVTSLYGSHSTRMDIDEIVEAIARGLEQPEASYRRGQRFPRAKDTEKLRLTPFEFHRN